MYTHTPVNKQHINISLVFTKCKKNIRDGFRLENLSWRLWYRQSVLQKKVEPKTSEDIDFSSREKGLQRTKSLPDLSQWSHQKNFRNTTSQKFYMVEQEDDESEEEELSSEEEEEPLESLTFTKNTDNALSKPTKSLLSDMLVENNSGLRRCQSRYSRLDQFFLQANTAYPTTVEETRILS